MALVMSQMPDVWRKVLAEHVPDGQQRCRECRNGGGTASWPCQTYHVAQEAKWVAEGNLPGTGPHGPVPSATNYSAQPLRPEPAQNHHDPYGLPPNGYAPPQHHAPSGPLPGPPQHGYGTPSWSGAHPSTGSLPATGAWPAPTSGSYPLPAVPPSAPSTGSHPTSWGHHGDPKAYAEPAMSAGRPGGDQPYGSTFDAPYGASFGVDDRPHAGRY